MLTPGISSKLFSDTWLPDGTNWSEAPTPFSAQMLEGPCTTVTIACTSVPG